MHVVHTFSNTHGPYISRDNIGPSTLSVFLRNLTSFIQMLSKSRQLTKDPILRSNLVNGHVSKFHAPDFKCRGEFKNSYLEFNGSISLDLRRIFVIFVELSSNIRRCFLQCSDIRRIFVQSSSRFRPMFVKHTKTA